MSGLTAPGLTATERAVAHQLASRLLAYPDDELLGQLDLIESAARALPGTVGLPLLRVVAHLRSADSGVLQAEYVRTIDQKRSCALFLTYYAHGDTRRRGMALLRFREAYAEAGATPPTDELPDHLAVVLEFTATIDAEGGIRLLQEHRAGLELLRRGLERVHSPYVDVLLSVLATLPPPTADDLAAAARIAAEGPPTELIGLSPTVTAGAPGDTSVHVAASLAATYPVDDSLSAMGARR